jgi:hypothetical protein
VLNGERTKQEILADPAQLEEVRTEAPAEAHLLCESTVAQLGRDGLPSDQDFAYPSSHGENLAGTGAAAG